MKRIAFYGGSFDPVHMGHVAIAHTLFDQFDLDEFVFIPAFHAPHKVRLKPTSAYDRYAMLCLVSQNEPHIKVCKIEIDTPERPFSVETLTRLTAEWPADEIFFVMGADSWNDIKTWREWEKVLALTHHLVVSRPGHHMGIDHVTDEIRARIVDLTGGGENERDIKTRPVLTAERDAPRSIFLTDSVKIDVSATDIRRKVREGDHSWSDDVTREVANYIEKYQIYS
jgi:nicotinate-nucleotide adenylyltransferase